MIGMARHWYQQRGKDPIWRRRWLLFIFGATLCLGMAASMAAVLMAAGAPGKRTALPNSRIMIHQPLGGTQGQAGDIEIYTKEMLKMKEQLNQILSKHTGRPMEQIERDTDRNFFMSAAECKEYGLVDEIIDKRR